MHIEPNHEELIMTKTLKTIALALTVAASIGAASTGAMAGGEFGWVYPPEYIGK